MRRAVRIVGAMALAALIVASGGCASCDTSCTGWEESDVTRLHGTFLGPAADDETHYRFDTVEHGELDVRVYGNADALDRGSDYVIPHLGRADDTEIQASLPHDCGCGPTMTHADGSAIATGFWEVTFDWWPSWTAIIFVAFALSFPLFAFAYFTRDRLPASG